MLKHARYHELMRRNEVRFDRRTIQDSIEYKYLYAISDIMMRHSPYRPILYFYMQNTVYVFMRACVLA